MNWRALLFLGLTLATGAQLWFIQRAGWDAAWRFWHLDARTPHFSDLRAITGASDSLERGFDPREENPGAPFKQRFNQTSLWLQLRHLGIHESDSTAVGLVMLAGYVVGLWWLAAGTGRLGAGLLGALVFSPAALLAVERGTTDLSVFFCLALAGHLAATAPRGAFAAVLAGFWLKLFPLAGVVVFLREPRSRAIRLGLVAAGLTALFCLLNFRELVDIGYKTEKGPHTSYGWAVLSLHLRDAGAVGWSQPVYVAGAALAFLGLGLAGWTARHVPGPAATSRALDFFRIGAAVYAGTFLLGASWDYRFIFALFLIPQLAEWIRSSDPSLRRWARGLLLALFVAVWSLALKDWAGASFAGQTAARALEETAKWALFYGCIHLLVRTLPAWAKPGRPTPPPAAPVPATR